MFDNIKEELQNFLDDLDKNIKNKDDLNYIKLRTTKLFDTFISEIDTLVDYKDKQLKEILKRQEKEEQKLDELQRKVDNIYRDIYEDDEEDFSISCPYCGEEFNAYLDEDLTEITCPECNNVIELDWNGNPDEEPYNGQDGCGGNCSHCNGCE